MESRLPPVCMKYLLKKNYINTVVNAHGGNNLMKVPMKILLIHPYISFDSVDFNQALSEPLGLLYIATYAENYFGSATDIKILDLYAMGYLTKIQRGDGLIVQGVSSEDQIITLISKENPDIIGIHCNFTGYFNDAVKIATLSRKAAPNAKIVMGGAYASQDAENILLKHPFVDFIVRGEGEITFCELIESIQCGNSTEEMLGLAFRKQDGNIQINPDRKFMEDIDITLNRKFIDMEAYKIINKQSFPLAMNYPIATIMASRGCPYDCIFCSTKNMWGRRWRARSPEHVVKEIDDLVNNYGIREIAFYDDQFLINKKWVHKICDLIIARDYSLFLTLPAGTSVWLADEALLKKMKKAGFYRLCFPIESGNADTIKFIRKPVKFDVVLNIIKVANRLGFWTVANFIIGFPYETKENIKETIKFAYNCGVDWPFFFIAKPFAGSDMYNLYLREGLICEVGTNTSSGVFVAKNDTLRFKASELQQLRLDAEKGYIKYKIKWCLNPVNFFGQILPKLMSISGVLFSIKIAKLMLRGGYKRYKQNKQPYTFSMGEAVYFNKIKQFLISIPIISILLAKLYLLFNKEFKKQNQFYSAFISQNDLVFDVGACYGKKLASFLKIKANVVVVEPQEKCMNFLKKTFSNSNLIFVQKALGERECLADFYEGEDHSLSTMSEGWMTYINRNFVNTNHKWNSPYKVQVTTLDKLIKKYGIPSYIKIDVEGFELHVLKGLSHSINMISIEFIRENIHRTIECINYLNKIAPRLYNLSVGEEHKFKFTIWKKYSEIMDYFASAEIPAWGDIYIKSLKNEE